MTDQAPERQISGLGARRTTKPDVSSLRAANRRVEVTTTAPVTPPAKQEPTSKKALTVYVEADVNARARAAFKATRAQENDASWSEFIQSAIERETHRREEAYNAGRSFGADNSPLPVGRPLK